MKKRIFNLVIVDESGSMYCIERQTVNGINETLQSIRMDAKGHDDVESYVTLVTFSSEHINTIYDNTAANEAKDINPKQYCPGGCTPLYDAVGRSVQNLRKQVADADSVMVTIITDGEENSSREFNHAMIHRLIEDMKKRDWIFSFIGANIDVERTSRDLGISFCMQFDQDEAGTSKMFGKVNSLRSEMIDTYVDCDCSMAEAAEMMDYKQKLSEQDS